MIRPLTRVSIALAVCAAAPAWIKYCASAALRLLGAGQGNE